MHFNMIIVIFNKFTLTIIFHAINNNINHSVTQTFKFLNPKRITVRKMCGKAYLAILGTWRIL